MDLNWSSLGEAVVISLGATVGVVIVFSLGVRALASREGSGVDTDRPSALSKAGAGLCFLVCAAAVGYGLYLIIPQFR